MIFTTAFAKQRFTRKWRLSSKVKAWNFTKNKLLKLVSSMKADFIFVGVNVNIIIQKKTPEKAHFMDEGLKIKGIKYFNVETRLLFAPSYQNFWLRACLH